MLSVEASGVMLRDLNIEVTSNDMSLQGQEAEAMAVRPGLGVTLDNVCVRGNVSGLSGEEGTWCYPRSIRLGCLAAAREHEFKLRLAIPVPCRLTTDIDGLAVIASRLGGGLAEVSLKLEALKPGIRLRGDVVIRTAHLTRRIRVTGSAAKTETDKLVRGDGQLIFDCQDPAAKPACSADQPRRKPPPCGRRARPPAGPGGETGHPPPSDVVPAPPPEPPPPQEPVTAPPQPAWHGDDVKETLRTTQSIPAGALWSPQVGSARKDQPAEKPSSSVVKGKPDSDFWSPRVSSPQTRNEGDSAAPDQVPPGEAEPPSPSETTATSPEPEADSTVRVADGASKHKLKEPSKRIQPAKPVSTAFGEPCAAGEAENSPGLPAAESAAEPPPQTEAKQTEIPKKPKKRKTVKPTDLGVFGEDVSRS